MSKQLACCQIKECPNCFARDKKEDKYCLILNNTVFIGKKCPFYQDREEYNKGYNGRRK